ncbi:MAG TPA: hypothetical protein VID93_06935, partial [Acidimicrobiales bacterium]
MTLRIARTLIMAGALTAPLGLVACGSSSSSSGSTSNESAESSEAAEESEGHEVVPDSEVTAGLAALLKLGATAVANVAAGQGSTGDLDAMEAKWASFEGTIKQNEVDLYLEMEDNLANLRSAVKDGDSTAAT